MINVETIWIHLGFFLPPSNKGLWSSAHQQIQTHTFYPCVSFSQCDSQVCKLHRQYSFCCLYIPDQGTATALQWSPAAFGVSSTAPQGFLRATTAIWNTGTDWSVVPNSSMPCHIDEAVTTCSPEQVCRTRCCEGKLGHTDVKLTGTLSSALIWSAVIEQHSVLSYLPEGETLSH